MYENQIIVMKVHNCNNVFIDSILTFYIFYTGLFKCCTWHVHIPLLFQNRTLFLSGRRSGQQHVQVRISKDGHSQMQRFSIVAAFLFCFLRVSLTCRQTRRNLGTPVTLNSACCAPPLSKISMRSTQAWAVGQFPQGQKEKKNGLTGVAMPRMLKFTRRDWGSGLRNCGGVEAEEANLSSATVSSVVLDFNMHTAAGMIFSVSQPLKKKKKKRQCEYFRVENESLTR